MGRRIWGFFLILFLLSLLGSGCCYFRAKDEMGKAGQLLSELKAAGGKQKAPYEYCSAETLLEIAHKEFDQYDYKASERFAIRAKSAAEAGLSKVKK